VQIGLTDNRYIVPDAHKLTYEEWLSFYLDKKNNRTIKKTLANFLNVTEESEIIKKIKWLGLLSDDKIGLTDPTPADILLDQLQKKWKFSKTDKDMVILQTEVEYLINEAKEKIVSTLVLYGKENYNTAMSETVGLPMGVGVNLILNNKISERGVIIPIYPDIYKPALKELAKMGIVFKEKLTRF